MTEHEDTEPNEDYTLKSDEVYTLRLFITGASPNSSRAIANLKVICEEHLKGNYELEIIDVYQQPLVAQSEQVIALPMLVKMSPSPVRRLIGNMSDKEKVLKGLGLIAAN
jgi:circadian clock protein KaiB